MTKVKKPKKQKLRNAEYYNFTAIFDSLYSRSKEKKNFYDLMTIITHEDNIKLAYRNIKKNHGSKTAGADKKTILDLQKWDTEKLVEHVQKRFSHYSANKVRRVEIPKGNGKMRPLGIPTIMDRLIQQAVLQVLEPICEAKFHERSNGFRPNRSAENALAQVVSEKLSNQIKKIQNPKNVNDENYQVHIYNSIVIGIQNYYRYVTYVNIDLQKNSFSC